MKARKLTQEGIHRFAEYIDARRGGEQLAAPEGLLQDDSRTSPLPFDMEVPEERFETRLQMAQVLLGAIGDHFSEVEHCAEFWSWLGLHYFDQLCPPRSRPRQPYSYVLRGSETNWHYFRHLVAGPVTIYALHGESGRVMLSGPVPKHPDMAEQLASRPEIITNPALIEVAHRLYYDPQREAPKRGSGTRGRAGTVRRLVDVCQQLELTYDLYAMDAADILRLLPPEFGAWAAGGTEDES